MLSMEKDKLRRVAPILSPLTAFSTDKKLYASHELIGAHLRLLQFDIADALEEREAAGKIAVRFFVELNQLENEDARVLLTMIAVPKVLMAPDASISPHLRLECALRVRSNLERARALFGGHVPAADALLPPWFKPEWDFADFLFSMILPHLQDSQAELEAFEALSSQEENVRNRFIDSISATYGMSVFANAGWANEQVANQASSETLSRYVKISEIVSSWNRPDIEIELICARAVVLDEILDDAKAAIALLNASVDKYGAVVPLIRQQAKTLSRVGLQEDAAKLMLRIEDTVGADSPLDRTLALRDAGVYSGKSGHFDDAVRQFSMAYDAIRSDDAYKPLAASLLIEKALGLWRAGSRPEAMVIAGQALDAVNKFLPSISRQAERSHQYARGIVGLMFKEAGASEELFDLPFTFGQASSLESESAELMGIDLKSISDNWRVLAAAEATSGINIGIDALSMSRQEGTLNCGVETGVRLGRYGAALQSGDANAVLKAARELAILMTETARLKENDGQPNQRIKIEEMARLLDQPPSGSDAEINAGECAVLDAILAASLANRFDANFLDDLRKSAAMIFGTTPSIEAIIKAASGKYAVGQLLQETLCWWAELH